MKTTEIRETDGYYVGTDKLAGRELVVQSIAGEIRVVAPTDHGAHILGDPERFEPFTRLAVAGVPTSDFVVDLDTAILHEQAEAISGSVVVAYLLLIGYKIDDDAPVEYRLEYPDGQAFDRHLGLLAVGQKLLDQNTTAWEA